MGGGRKQQEGDKKGGKRKNKGGKKRKNKLQLIGAEETRLNNPESIGLHSEVAVDEPQPELSKKEQRKLIKKMSRKSGRKQNKRKNKKNSEALSSDLPAFDQPKLRFGLAALEMVPKQASVHSGRKHGRGKKGRRGRRIPCTTDDDCLNGAMCFTNRKGHKFCKGNGMDKTAGKKCHRSEQCARGLMCFVKSADPTKGKHHKRKGICADPETADLTKGSFMPFHNASQ